MTKLLQKALEAVRQLPPESQDDIARAILQMAMSARESDQIDPEHLPFVLQGLAEAERGEFASDADIEAAFKRFDQ